jgi:hypothetical protein
MGVHGGFAKAVNRGHSREPHAAGGHRQQRCGTGAGLAGEAVGWAGAGRRAGPGGPARTWRSAPHLVCDGQDPAGRRPRPHRRYVRRALPRRDCVARGARMPRRAAVSRRARDPLRAFYRGAVSRRIVREGRAARRAVRIVSGRCGLRTALRAGRVRGAVRAGSRRVARRQRHFGPLASGNDAPHRAESGLPHRQALSGRMLLRYAWPILVAQGLWGLVALRHGRGWPWLCGKVEGLRRFSRASRHAKQPGDRRRPLAQILCDGEREIRRVQRESGRDSTGPCIFCSPRVGQSDTCTREAGIVVVTHESEAEIGECLDRAQPTGAEIVVVDNASTDRTCLEVAAAMCGSSPIRRIADLPPR